jgi:hypothetical protein
MRLLTSLLGLLALSSMVLVAISYALRSHATGQALHGASPLCRVQAASREAGLLFLVMLLSPALGWRRSSWRIGRESHGPPLVLVGGTYGPTTLLSLLRRFLNARIDPRQILLFAPPRNGPHQASEALAEFIRDGAGFLSAPRVDVVAVGAGALPVLAALDRSDLPVGRVVLLAPPMRGSRIGVFLPGSWGRALRDRFESPPPEEALGAHSDRVTVLTAGEDAIFLPDETSTPPNMEHHRIEGVGHLGLILAPPTAQHIARILAD